MAIAARTRREARGDHVVYSPLVVQGEKAVELRGHYDFDGDDALDGGQQYKAEFEWSPFARWRTELLAEFEQEPGGDLETTEIAWENVFQLTEQGQYWADFGVLAEYAHSLEHDGHDALELGLLAQKDVGRHETRVNLAFERPFESGADTEMEYAWQYRYRLERGVRTGRRDVRRPRRVGQHGLVQRPRAADRPRRFGKLRTASGAFKYEVGLLFALKDETPDTTAALPARIRVPLGPWTQAVAVTSCRPRRRALRERRACLAIGAPHSWTK